MPERTAGHFPQRVLDDLATHMGEITAATRPSNRAGVRFPPRTRFEHGGHARLPDSRTFALDLGLDHLTGQGARHEPHLSPNAGHAAATAAQGLDLNAH